MIGQRIARTKYKDPAFDMKNSRRATPRLTPREMAVFAPLLFLVLWMGVYPSSFLKPMQPSVANLLERVQVTERGAAAKLAIR